LKTQKEERREAILSLVGALFLELNDEWAVQRGRLYEPGNDLAFER
jgi:hypothetical protein